MMMNSLLVVDRFARLDRATIALELCQGGRKTLLRGIGAYGRDPDLGSVLKVNIPEIGGDFDFVLREDLFDGEITSGGASGCEFQICLSTNCIGVG